jgi:cytochrome c oxidase assembly protein subunit 15
MFSHDAPFHRPLHVLAILVAAATFPLIFMGGLVTTHGAGMAVPDWPNTYGYNMFTFPPSQWVGGIWYEHVHRLWGSLVGFLSILLCLNAWGPGVRKALSRRWLKLAAAVLGLGSLLGIAAFAMYRADAITPANLRHLEHVIVGLISLGLIAGAAGLSRRREARRWVRWLCTLVLVAVVVQGVMGGLRVTEVNLTLAMLHGCFAHVFFCLAGLTVLVTSRWWIEAPNLSLSPAASGGRRVAWIGAAGAVALLLQLVLGAAMRHNDAGLAIPDLPLAYGRVVTPTESGGLAEINRQRVRFAADETVTDPRVRRQLAAPVTLAQVWMHFGHRLGAIAVTGMLAWLIVRSWRQGLWTWSAVVAGLLVAQFTLGVLTVLWRKPADIASLHVACGALLLLSTVVLTTLALRLYSRPVAVTPAAAAVPRTAGLAVGVS